MDIQLNFDENIDGKYDKLFKDDSSEEELKQKIMESIPEIKVDTATIKSKNEAEIKSDSIPTIENKNIEIKIDSQTPINKNETEPEPINININKELEIKTDSIPNQK